MFVPSIKIKLTLKGIYVNLYVYLHWDSDFGRIQSTSWTSS